MTSFLLMSKLRQYSQGDSTYLSHISSKVQVPKVTGFIHPIDAQLPSHKVRPDLELAHFFLWFQDSYQHILIIQSNWIFCTFLYTSIVCLMAFILCQHLLFSYLHSFITPRIFRPFLGKICIQQNAYHLCSYEIHTKLLLYFHTYICIFQQRHPLSTVFPSSLV